MLARLRKRRIGLACCLAAAAASAAAWATPQRAEASPLQFSMMQDDNQLIYGTDGQRERALTLMKLLGVDALRVTVLWNFLAPKTPLSDTAAADPNSYRGARWDRFDELVRSAHARGMEVHLNLTGPGHRWTQQAGKEKPINPAFRPNARAYGKFVEAVTKRYSGRFEDSDGSTLPRVSSWSLWNEPNFPSWLTPQSAPSRRVGGKQVPVAPALYRELVVSGAKALLRTGHSDDIVSIGETAPLGSAKLRPGNALRPALFIREFFCVDGAIRPYTGENAKARRCDRVRKLDVLEAFPRLTWGHHPYTKKASPARPSGIRDAITMANIGALPKLLDRVAERRPSAFPTGALVLLTENGYETTPPDPYAGVSPGQQASYNNESDYLAYRNPRIGSVTQFQLDDVPPLAQFSQGSRQFWRTYQSGLFDLGGQPKPSASAYALQFGVRKAGAVTEFWGQVRFTPNGTTQTVRLQAKQGNGFANVGEPVAVTNANGFFTVRFPNVPAGSVWRVAWTSPDGADVRFSRQTTAP